MHEIEIIVNLWLQNMGKWLLIPMQLFSFLGTQNAYLIMMSILYWCIDNQLGKRLGVILLLENGFNMGLKWLFRAPRPYWIDTRVQALSTESSFGVPSGHAMISIGFWGEIASWVKRTWGKICIMLIIFFIGISRIYLGVHFLSDVIVGWLFGISILLLMRMIEKPFIGWFHPRPFNQKIILAFLSSLSIIIVLMGLKSIFSNWELPKDWINIAQQTAPGSQIDPMRTGDVLILAGTWFGMISGFILITKNGDFETNGKIIHKVLRFLIGFVVILLLAFGPNFIFQKTDSIFSYVATFVQYGLIGFWIAALAPSLFFKLKLLKKIPSGGKK